MLVISVEAIYELDRESDTTDAAATVAEMARHRWQDGRSGDRRSATAR
ncbi:MAG TPA: hypothetical protein VHM89_09400 [Acidimicrobiales bacterium]|nr:hypothetical protein [Acidimicrobiales bacterium]